MELKLNLLMELFTHLTEKEQDKIISEIISILSAK